MHTILPFLLAMIAAIVLLEMWATRLRIAYPILLVVAGLAISFIPGLPVVRINPDLIFLIFLPPLLFEASWAISFKEMKKWWRIIGSFAFLVVFFTATSVAIATNYFIPGFSIALGFLLGGIVAPPDAVSTGAITRFVKIPRSTSTILEGESLLNDASSLIIFRFALVAIGTGQFIWQQAALTFLWMVIGGAGIGLLLAWIFVQLHKRLSFDASSDIALTIIEPYFMYWLAEEIGCSGVLAVVAGGLYMSAQRMVFLNSSSRLQGFHVWESFIFILNGLVFLIIGLGLPEIVEGLKKEGIPLGTAINYGLLVTGVLIASRIISAYGALVATFLFRRNVLPTRGSRSRFMMPLLLGWSGMRGVVSLAAALAIPITLNGAPFPQRNLILFITFIVILVTLVVQGLTLPQLIKRSGAFDAIVLEESTHKTRHDVKHGLKKNAQEFLKKRLEQHPEHKINVGHLVKIWEEKGEVEGNNMTAKAKAVIIEMLDVQREYLLELNKDPKIDESIIREALYTIDLEEEKWRRS
ncbi:MAG: Na+/H+ antiporter [Bacteroidota bacterium]